MKKNITLAIAIMFSGLKIYGQRYLPVSDTTSYQFREAGYLRTHKILNTVAWMSLGTGIATASLGIAAVAASVETGKLVKWPIPAGLSLIGASIPLFVISHHYKKKAASLSFGNQQVFIPQQSGFTSKVAPTLCLRVPF
jgi:hypothetical protein